MGATNRIRISTSGGGKTHSDHSRLALIAALEEMVLAYKALMPGLRYISVQDYEQVLNAPVRAARALAEARR
jgi:hypothetical protein